MLRNHAPLTFGSVGFVVNGVVTAVAVVLIFAAYFSAVGQIAVA